MERFRHYYEKLSQFDTLFNDFIGDDLESFVQCFMRQDEAGELHATGLFWEVDDVGIFFLTDIVPELEAQAHFTFWDRRLSGRADLCYEMCKYVLTNFHLHRLSAEVPVYAVPIMNFVEKIGFVKEGRKREATKYKGDWFHVNMYSLLISEVENGRENEER